MRSTQSTLEYFRMDKGVYKDVAKLYDIDELQQPQRPRRTRNLPRHFDDSFLDTDGVTSGVARRKLTTGP